MSHFQRATLRPRRSRRGVAAPPLAIVNNDPRHDAHLLRVLERTVTPGFFDRSNVSANAYYGFSGELREALRFLDLRYDRSKYLTGPSLNRLQRWIDKVAGRDIDGLRLVKNDLGWCTIEIVAMPKYIVGFGR